MFSNINIKFLFNGILTEDQQEVLAATISETLHSFGHTSTLTGFELVIEEVEPTTIPTDEEVAEFLSDLF